MRLRRLALPPCVPRALRRVDVNKRVADRFETTPDIARELLRRQNGCRVQHSIPRPVVVIEEGLEVGQIHGWILDQLRQGPGSIPDPALNDAWINGQLGW